MQVTNFSINPKQMFSGQLDFLSNFYPARVTLTINAREYVFPNAEAAFQAGKCKDAMDVEQFTRVKSGGEAKRLGRSVSLRPNWEENRVVWMERVVRAKFSQNPDLKKKLDETFPIVLKETNYWHDTFWGVCNGKGENNLGRILMKIRDEGRVDGLQQTIHLLNTDRWERDRS